MTRNVVVNRRGVAVGAERWSVFEVAVVEDAGVVTAETIFWRTTVREVERAPKDAAVEGAKLRAQENAAVKGAWEYVNAKNASDAAMRSVR